MTNDDWKRVNQDNTPFPGPRAFFVSGYDPPQVEVLRELLDGLGYTNAPIRCCAASQMDVSFERALSTESADEPLGQGRLPYTMIISGMTAADAGKIMQGFSASGLPRPIFATSTETNLQFTVKELLRHLLAEQRAMVEASQQAK